MWIKLKRNLDGPGLAEDRRMVTLAKLESAVYNGKNKFTIDDYVALNMDCHVILDNVDRPLFPEDKVKYFRRGLKDPALAPFLAGLRSNHALFKDFAENVSLTKREVLRLKTEGTGGERQIASVTTTSSQKSRKGGKTKQKIGKGGNGGGAAQKDQTPSGVTLHAGRYTPKEYAKLKPFERAKVKKMRDDAEKNGTAPKVGVAAITTVPDESVKVKSISTVPSVAVATIQIKDTTAPKMKPSSTDYYSAKVTEYPTILKAAEETKEGEKVVVVSAKRLAAITLDRETRKALYDERVDGLGVDHLTYICTGITKSFKPLPFFEWDDPAAEDDPLVDLGNKHAWPSNPSAAKGYFSGDDNHEVLFNGDKWQDVYGRTWFWDVPNDTHVCETPWASLDKSTRYKILKDRTRMVLEYLAMKGLITKYVDDSVTLRNEPCGWGTIMPIAFGRKAHEDPKLKRGYGKELEDTESESAKKPKLDTSAGGDDDGDTKPAAKPAFAKRLPNGRWESKSGETMSDETISSSTDDGELRCSLDSHADTSVAGSNTLRIIDVGRTVTVSSYDPKAKSEPEIPVSTVATIWDDLTTGKSYLLVIHEALYFGDRLKHSLLNPNQLRNNGLVVEDVPRQFDSRSSHSIFEPTSDVRIPLKLHGVCSGFVTRKPTWDDYVNLPHVTLTSDAPWHPGSTSLADAESRVASVTTSNYLPIDNHARIISAVSTYDSCQTIAHGDHLNDEGLYDRLVASVNVAANDFDGDGLAGRDDPDVFPGCNKKVAPAPEQSDVEQEVSALGTSERRSVITPEALARSWGIGLVRAKQTLKVTTQAGLRNLLAPGERKIRLKVDHLKYPKLRGDYFTDTMKAKVKSVREHRYSQVFTNGCGFDHIYHADLKSRVGDCLVAHIIEVGIPQTLISDNSKEQTSRLVKFTEICRKYHIRQMFTSPYSPWQNRAEDSIGYLKRGVRRVLRRTKAPKALWCYCADWVFAIRRLSAMDILDGRTPFEATMGSTPDISMHAQFDWYEPVYYHDPVPSFPEARKKIGRWIGVADNSIDLLTNVVLTEKGTIIATKNVWAISTDAAAQPAVKDAMASLDASIAAKLGDEKRLGTLKGKIDEECLDDTIPGYIFEGDEALDDPEDTILTKPDQDEHVEEVFDKYLSAQVFLAHGGEPQKGTVLRRKIDHDGVPVGRRNDNPILDTREYEVEFADGTVEAIGANLIAESMYSQVDDEGFTLRLLTDIVGHRTNGHAVTKDDGFTEDKQGNRHPRKTTQGWEMEVEWKDGTTSWLALKDLKESDPVRVAEYAVANKIAEEPAFAWWVRSVLRRRERIIKKIKVRNAWTTNLKFGIEVPRTVKEALEIDRRTNTHFWREAIDKEMLVANPAFKIMEPGEALPIGCKFIKCHMIFDVKMDLTRKAQFVAGGHMTEPPKDMTYSSVVSRDSIRLAFLLAALNDLKVLSADVQGAYLNAKTSENIYTECGLEFGHNAGKRAVLVLALYGLKSSGARWRDHMAATLREAKFTSCLADPDVWMRPQCKENGDKYWEYVLVYVDDILCCSHNPQAVLDYIGSKYTLKKGSVGEPTMYLGAEIKKWDIPNSEEPGRTHWAMSADSYVKRAVDDVELHLRDIGERLATKISTPLASGYRPEIDVTPELDPKRATYYQGLIGVLRWMCELGRIDILTDVALMSRFLAAPREGHLAQVFHIFAYLKHHMHKTMVFDSTEPTFDPARHIVCDWQQFYPGAKELIPPNAPEIRGKSVSMTCYVDADHGGCRVTRRSHTGVLIFVQRAPILWYSKRQNTVEASTFGSEYVAAKIAVELIEGLRYKLRMMGVAIDGPTTMLCDNQSVVQNSSRPESTLKKKHNAIAYHRVREAQAAKIISIVKEDGENNLADLFTKCLPGPRLRQLVDYILW